MIFNGHPIYRVSYRDTVAYFLRMPDGNAACTGYADTGYQSLKRLADGQIDKLSAIDGTTSYYGWRDMVATLRAIIDFERGRAPSVQLNVAELDPVINPNDHSDHLMTAKAALDAAEDLTCARRLHYVGYASANLPENLSPQDRDLKCSAFAVTLAGVLVFDHPAGWKHHDQNYVGRDYFGPRRAAGLAMAPMEGRPMATKGHLPEELCREAPAGRCADNSLTSYQPAAERKQPSDVMADERTNNTY